MNKLLSCGLTLWTATMPSGKVLWSVDNPSKPLARGYADSEEDATQHAVEAAQRVLASDLKELGA